MTQNITNNIPSEADILAMSPEARLGFADDLRRRAQREDLPPELIARGIFALRLARTAAKAEPAPRAGGKAKAPAGPVLTIDDL